MSLRLIFCCLFVCTGVHFIHAQFSEDFSDGDFNNNPVWLGDTSAFVVTPEGKLQLAAPPETGDQFLYTSSNAIEDATWEFDVQLDFNPSSTNYADVYLVMDIPDFNTASGYFVRIGNAQDEISLYRQEGADRHKIIDGRDKTIDTKVVNVNVKVTRDKTGTWALFSDVGLSGNYEPEGEIFDDNHIGSTHFGILCKYTATRSDKFFFDNISIEGNPKSDSIPPSVTGIAVVGDIHLEVSFDEKISLNKQNPEIHFLEQCNLAQPNKVDFLNDSTLLLTFTEPIPENITCQLLINNISDRAKNVLTDTSVVFEYIPPRQPGFNELLITEIMADQTPNVELPEYEYLEIFNPLEESLLVKNLELRIRGDSRILDDFEIAPEEYVILCPSTATDAFSEYGKTIGLSNWKALLNNGDTISIFNKYQEQVFSVAYQKSWYGDAKKSDGGYSLEMIDTRNPCGEKSVWKASENKAGGSPGKANSVRTSKPDLTSPAVENVFPESASKILVTFNEKIKKETIDSSKIKITPSMSISSLTLSEPLRNSFLMNLESDLEPKQIYSLAMAGIKDCVGNTIKENKETFVLPEKADSLDILFNEVLFNPLTGSNDFIELVNNSGKYIDLKNWKFQREIDGEVIQEVLIIPDHFIVKPGEIFVFTEDKNILAGQYPHTGDAKVIETKLPQMNNDEGIIILTNELGKVIDRLHYHENYHHHMIRNKKGVSLERISYSGGSGNPEIWQSAASTVGFATPGFKNSQFLNSGIDKAFFIDPPVFNPNNDGYKDFASIHFEMEQSYLASLFIYDISGRVVKQLLNNQNLPTQGFIIWEGDDKHGQKVPVGNYIIYFELIGQGGEKKIYKDKVAVAAKF